MDGTTDASGQNNQNPYLYGGVPRRGWSGGGNCGGGTAQPLQHDCYASPRGIGPAGTARADKLHNRLTRTPLSCIYTEGVAEEDGRCRGLELRLTIATKTIQESLATEGPSRTTAWQEKVES